MKVIELAHVMAGPVCGLMLADMGADVIKVEKVPGGDDTRLMTPPEIDDEAAAFLMMNRNKRGMAINLKTAAGKALLLRMLETADVVIENFRAGTMERLGLGYEDLKKTNPGLIYCAIFGFGRNGPYASRGGFDLIAQGMSGLMSMTGEGPGRPPCKVGAPVTDITAGILAAMAVSAAYAHKLKTGEGQMFDTSLFEAGITHTYSLATGEAPVPMGSAHPLNGPYQAFETADGWITVGAANHANWLRLTEAVGRPDLAEDERFLDNAGRMANLAALGDILSEIFRTRRQSEWLDILENAGVPAGPVLDVCEMHQDPHALAWEMVVETNHSRLGPVQTIGCPVKFSKTPSAINSGAPVYGEHTRAILSEYGIKDDDVEDLITSGAVVAAEK